MRKKSIITDDLDHCFMCGSPYVQMHHVFHGSYRKKADIYKLIVPLCVEHHTGQNGVHNQPKLDKELKQLGMSAFEKSYGMPFESAFGRRF